MNSDLPLKYSQPPYILIGLDLKNELLNREHSIVMQAIFFKVNDCKDFLVKQTANDECIVITSGQLTPDELSELRNDREIEAIYLFSESNHLEKQFQCLYTKPMDRNHLETSVQFLRKHLFLFGLAVVLLFAVLFPHVAASSGPLHAEYTIQWGCIIFVFLLSGLSLPTRTLKHELFHLRLHLFVQVFSLVFIPMTVYGICLLLAQTSFNKVLLGGLIAMACASTLISGNV